MAISPGAELKAAAP